MGYDEEYFKGEEFQELLESYEMAVQSGELPFMDADDLVDIADYYSMQGSLEEAMKAVDYALDFYPGATLPNVFKAREALMADDIPTAHFYADQIDDHDAPDYHYLQAEIWIAENRIDEADNYLRQYAHSVPPDEYQDFVKDCANLYINYGISDKAYEWLMRSKGDDSDDYKELMAHILFGLGKYKDSERIFNELIDHDPYSKYYWNALANAQFMNEDYAGAITSSEYAIAIDPSDAEGIISKANGLFRLGNYEEALKYYRRYSENIPDDEVALLHQGVCLVNIEHTEEALDVLQEALELALPDSEHLVAIYQELAFCYSHLKQPEKAMEMMEKTETLPCDHIEMLVVKGHLQLENGLVDEALECFKNAIVRSDNMPAVILRVIVSLYDNHYVNACYEMFQRFFRYVRQTEQDYNEGYAYMALCCYDLGRTAEFLTYLREAARRNAYEARLVLGFLFPDGMEPKDYYQYMKDKLNQ